MKVTYKPLWKLLIDHNMNKTDLIHEVKISPNTLARLSKNEFVNLKTICKIAEYFSVQISEIVLIIYE